MILPNISTDDKTNNIGGNLILRWMADTGFDRCGYVKKIIIVVPQINGISRRFQEFFFCLSAGRWVQPFFLRCPAWHIVWGLLHLIFYRRWSLLWRTRSRVLLTFVIVWIVGSDAAVWVPSNRVINGDALCHPDHSPRACMPRRFPHCSWFIRWLIALFSLFLLLIKCVFFFLRRTLPKTPPTI